MSASEPIASPEISSPEVDSSPSEVDADEAAYQAEMAALRERSSKDSEDDSEEADDDVSDEEREYNEAMAKAKGDKKSDEKKDDKKPVPKKADAKESESKVWKLKVNGKEVDFDASNEESIKAHVQKGLAAQEKFDHSAMIEKRAKHFIEALKTNPEEVLTHPSLGINFRKIAEDFLYKTIQTEMMTPEQREYLKQKEELESYRQTEAQRKAEVEEKEKEELKERYRADWSKKFSEALTEANLPKTDWTVQRMAQYMRQAISKGYKHIQPGDVVEMVKEDWLNAQRQMYSNMDGDTLLEILGKETVDKIRTSNLKRVGSSFGKQAEATPARDVERAPSKPKKVYGSTEEMMRAIKR